MLGVATHCFGEYLSAFALREALKPLIRTLKHHNLTASQSFSCRDVETQPISEPRSRSQDFLLSALRTLVEFCALPRLMAPKVGLVLSVLVPLLSSRQTTRVQNVTFALAREPAFAHLHVIVDLQFVFNVF